MTAQIDDQDLADELAELEQEELNKRLAGAEAAPIHSPSAAPAGKTANIVSRLFEPGILMSAISGTVSQDTGASYRGGRGRSRVTRATGTTGYVMDRKRTACGQLSQLFVLPSQTQFPSFTYRPDYFSSSPFHTASTSFCRPFVSHLLLFRAEFIEVI